MHAFSGEYDVLIIGGGIVGAGVARDAALRGLRVGLVDRYDFAFGTSSRSSRLLHGGIRYLAQGRVGLVREASREKHVLQRIAPHLTQPLPFVFLTYKGSHYPLWKLRFGVKLYDWLCGAGNLGRSSTLSSKETLAHLGGATPATNGLTGSARYFDALTNDARLVLDTLRSAAKAGAELANYTQFESAERDGKNWVCRVSGSDEVGGRLEAPEREQEIRAKTIVCATGPWADGMGNNRLHLRLTKGIHLVIDRARLPVPDAVVMTEGKRVLFAIPWGERVILGTTDTDFDAKSEGAIAQVCAEAEDIAYVLKVTNQSFPGAKLTSDDVRATWAGLRPLIANPNGTPSDISRSHEIRVSDAGWIEVAGGKLTTYRLMAEQAVDRVEEQLSRTKTASVTATLPLVSPDEAAGISAIVPPAVTREAVLHYCRNEWARHLDDVMIRRSGWHYYLPNSTDVAKQVAVWMCEILGWDSARERQELERYSEHQS